MKTPFQNSLPPVDCLVIQKFCGFQLVQVLPMPKSNWCLDLMVRTIFIGNKKLIQLVIWAKKDAELLQRALIQWVMTMNLLKRMNCVLDLYLKLQPLQNPRKEKHQRVTKIQSMFQRQFVILLQKLEKEILFIKGDWYIFPFLRKKTQESSQG